MTSLVIMTTFPKVFHWSSIYRFELSFFCWLLLLFSFHFQSIQCFLFVCFSIFNRAYELFGDFTHETGYSLSLYDQCEETWPLLYSLVQIHFQIWNMHSALSIEIGRKQKLDMIYRMFHVWFFIFFTSVIKN